MVATKKAKHLEEATRLAPPPFGVVESVLDLVVVEVDFAVVVVVVIVVVIVVFSSKFKTFKAKWIECLKGKRIKVIHSSR